MSEQNREKEEKLFRAMSGVDEDLLLRSERSGSKNTGKVRKFPMNYVSRIVAACLCFAVAGGLYVTMSSTKMADSTSADTAGNECAAAEAVYEAAQTEDTAGGAEMEEITADVPEGAVEEVMTDEDGFIEENAQQAAQNSMMSADTEYQTSVSGNEASGEVDSTEAVKEQEEETLTEKEVRPQLRKMTTKGHTKQ